MLKEPCSKGRAGSGPAGRGITRGEGQASAVCHLRVNCIHFGPFRPGIRQRLYGGCTGRFPRRFFPGEIPDGWIGDRSDGVIGVTTLAVGGRRGRRGYGFLVGVPPKAVVQKRSGEPYPGHHRSR